MFARFFPSKKKTASEAQLRLGNGLRDQGRFDEAAACYRSALALEPDFPAAHVSLGNILNDQTLFGVGGGGIDPSGTTLGRIGYGYIYPNFVAQITYSTAGGKPGHRGLATRARGLRSRRRSATQSSRRRASESVACRSAIS